MTALRLLARSGAGHFSWLPQPVAGARLCPFLVTEAERLRVLDKNEADAVTATAAASPAASLAADMAGEREGDEEVEGDNEQEEGEDRRDEIEPGRHETDEHGIPSGWVCCPVCYREHPIAECCLCDGHRPLIV